jgi:hypothetical protein
LDFGFWILDDTRNGRDLNFYKITKNPDM